MNNPFEFFLSREAARHDLEAAFADKPKRTVPKNHIEYQNEAKRSALALSKNEPLLEEAFASLIAEAESITAAAA